MNKILIYRKKHSYNLGFQKPQFGEFNAWQTIGKVRLRILVAVTLVVLGLFATQLIFANSLSTDGQKLANIQAQIAKLESENTTLEADIARHSSIINLVKRASDLNFQKPSKVVTF